MSVRQKNLSISLAQLQYDLLKDIKNKGYFPSMSQIVRHCINHSIDYLLKNINKINNAIKKNNLPKVLKYLKANGYIIRQNSQKWKHIPLGNIFHNSHNIIKQK